MSLRRPTPLTSHETQKPPQYLTLLYRHLAKIMMRKILTVLTIVLIVNFLVAPIFVDGAGMPIVCVSFVLILARICFVLISLTRAGNRASNFRAQKLESPTRTTTTTTTTITKLFIEPRNLRYRGYQD
jgi:hypothetical protein